MRVQAAAPDRFAHRPVRDPEVGPRRPQDLDDKQKAELLRLQQRDAEVRAHEAAHAAAAGMLGGGASYDYVTGPDGRQYAIGGEVQVRISSGSTPEEAIRNAAQVRAAALAPAEPSGQDRAVAAQAAAIEAAARAQLAELRSAENPPGPNRSEASADPAETARQLEAERRSTRGSWRHMHLASGCGSCSAAAARYV